jgi:hypothetical protein
MCVSPGARLRIQPTPNTQPASTSVAIIAAHAPNRNAQPRIGLS